MELDTFELNLVDWFSRVTGREVGFADLPSDTPHMPYVVLTPLIQPRGYGTMANPEAMRDYVFQMQCVGRDPRQVRWMSEKVRRAWLGDLEVGVAPATLTGVEGATVLDGSRQSDSMGAILKSPEGKLFNTTDTYRMKVE